MKQKKAQVTIFAILGLILVVVLALILLSINNQKTTKLDDESITQRINTYISQCTEDILQDYTRRALQTGGYGYYPDNVVRYQNNLYVLSYSVEGYYMGIYEPEVVEEFIKQEMSFTDLCIYNLMLEDYEIYGDEITINEINTQITFEEGAIITNFEYEYEVQEKTIQTSLAKRHKTNLAYFLDETNKITDKILMPRQIDSDFNYQFCRTLSQTQNIKPRYAVDFLKEIGNQENLNFIFEKTYFIITIEKDDEQLSFAIRPEQTGTFC
ncbi:MAG: hypothetical protein ACLFN8_03240 [Candidatus Woesearchaeota archaeon]